MSSTPTAAQTSIAQSMLPQFDMEMANTRKTIDRAPDDKFDYKPHPKSNDIRWMIGHLIGLAGWPKSTCEQDFFDFAPIGGERYKLPQPKNRAEALELFDKNVAESRAALARTTDADMAKDWSLLGGGQLIMKIPRIAVLRSMILSHIIHHRAQLTVYYRLNDIPVPALYGPSADEQ